MVGRGKRSGGEREVNVGEGEEDECGGRGEEDEW